MGDIQGSPRFEKVRLRFAGACFSSQRWRSPSSPSSQVKDLGSGNFGLARLERELATGELVAIKYLRRGSGVRPR